MCGCKTPEAKRGTYAANAPELDHIIPLAKGGAHSKANTACSCRRCNIAKSDKVLGQPSLLAAL
ncbi:MAG: putative HNH endonuclease [Prokaryotic dsDNA virus sp.]|nr:MAG: putative HNH endonuclease [Prokaryotic dsDNA virus sp.]